MKRELRVGFVAQCNRILNAVQSNGVRFLVVMMMLMSGVMSGQITETFSSWTAHASYGNWTQSGSGGTWTMTDCIVTPAAVASGTGSIGLVQLRHASVLELPEVATGGVGIITVKMRVSATTSSPSLTLQKSVGGGAYSTINTFNTGLSTTGTTYTFAVNDASSNIKLKLIAANRTFYIHDISTTTYSVAPSIVLANNGTQITTSNITEGTTNNILHKFQLGVTTANATLTGVGFTTAGGYDAADITNIKLRYSTDATLDGADVTLSTLTSPGVAGGKTFPSFSSQIINSGATGYFFITADIASGASTGGNTISVNAIATGGLTFSSGTKSGSTTAGGAQTIVAPSTPTLSNDALTAFGNQCINGTYGPNSFTITGVALTSADVTVASLSGFTFSTSSGGTYTAFLSLTQPGGACSQEIFVKFDPTLVQSYNGNIVIGGGGATNINVAASGSGINTPITLGPTSAGAMTTTTATLGASISNIGCSNATERGIYWSTTNGFDDGDGTKFSSMGSFGTGFFSQAVTGLPANTTIYFKAFATNGGGTVYTAQDSFVTLKTEPTNQAGSFACGTTTTTTIPLTWTDATGVSVPDGYLIKWSTTSFAAIISPVDGVIESSLTSVYKAQGVQTHTVTGLTSGTTYYFKIWSYTNSGTVVDYNLSSVPQTSCATLAGPCFSMNGPDFPTKTNTYVGDNDSGGSPTTTIRLASGDSGGSISTPTTGVNAGDVTVTFRAKGWSGTETSVTVILDGQTININNLPTSFGEITLNFTSVSSNPTLVFSTVTNKRLHIGNVKIFCTPACTPPTIQATALSTNTITDTSVSTGWTAGNGNGTMIVVSNGTVVAPTSGTAYTPDLAWSAAAQINTANRVVFRAAGSTAGPVTGLSPQTQYTVTAYEYNTTDNCYNTTSAPSTAFYTLSTEPGSTPVAFSCTPTDYDKMNFSFSAASSITNADGYLILRKVGSAPTGVPVDGTSYSAGATIGDATVAAIVNTTVATTANITGLSASTTYYFTLIPFNWNGTNTPTYNYRTTAIAGSNCTTSAAPSLASDIVLSGMSYTANILYNNFQATTPISAETGTIAVMGITVQDGGGSIDGDGLPTIVTGITFTGVTGASILRSATLFDGTIPVAAGTIGANTITFSSMTLNVGDDGTKDYVLRVSFLNSGITDNTQLAFTVAAANVTTASGLTSSQMTAFSSITSNTTLDNNKIEVVADRLAFVQQPSNTSNGGMMTPAVTVRATDINSNLDLDFASSVSVACSTPLALTGNPVSTTASSGLATFSTLVHTIDGTYTMIGSSTGITSSSPSNSYTIATVSFTTNDYRSTAGGTWSTQNNGTATWQKWDGDSWETSTRPTASSSNVYIRHTISSNGTSSVASVIVEAPNSAEGTPGGNYTLGHTTTFSTRLLIEENGVMEATNAFTNDGEFEIKDEGEFTINYVANNNSAIWNGTEIFHPNSTFIIKEWSVNNSNNTYRPLINGVKINTNLYNGYTAIFGNLKIDLSNSGEAGGSFILLEGGISINLAHGNLDLLQPHPSNNINIKGTGSLTTSGIGGNFNVDDAFASSRRVLIATTGAIDFTINGDMQLDGATTNVTSSTAATNFKVTIKGDLNITPSAVLDFVASSTANPIINLDLEGNLNGVGSGLLRGQSNGANFNLNFTGTYDDEDPSSIQTIDIESTSTTENNRLNFNIKSGAYVLLTNHFELGTNSKLTVETGGTLDFGYNGTDPLNVTISGSQTGTAFESQTGSTLKITSDAGITTTLTPLVGNVRTTSRTFTALGNFHYIGKLDQNTGDGLPTNVNNLVIYNEGATNDVTITNAAVQVNGNLLMQQGNIVSTLTPSHLLQIGIDTGTTGTLTHVNGVVKGDGVTEGIMRRYMASTTVAGEGLFPLGTTTDQKRFIATEFTATNGGYLDATFVVGEDMGDNGVLDLSSVPAVGSCAAFTVLNTDENLFWRMSPQTGALTSGTHKVTLRKDSSDNICKKTVLKRTTTTADWINPGDHLVGTVNGGDIIVNREEMTGNLKDFGLGDGNCSGTTIMVTTSAWTGATRLTPVEVNNTITLPAGVSRACECLVTSGVTVTIPDGATLEVVNGITLESGASIIIQNNGSLVQLTDVDNATTNNNTGNITMHRHTKPMYRYDYTYWSSPVFEDGDGVKEIGEFNLFDLSPLTLSDKYYKWNHAGTAPLTSPGWQLIYGGTEAMVPGRGYIIRAPQSYPIEGSAGNPSPIINEDGAFIGKPNNGIVEHAVSGPDKWNLIGNPYPSAISAEEFLNANSEHPSNLTNEILEGTLYFWTHNTAVVPSGTGTYVYNSGDYASYNGTGGAGTTEEAPSSDPDDDDDGQYINATIPNGYIAAGQAFFVKGTANGEAIFNNSMRETGQNNQFFKPAPTEPLNNWTTTGKHRVWLNLKGETKGFSQVLVGYIENATNGLDTRFDGETFGGNQVTLYSVSDTKKLVIQGRALPFDNQDEVPLGYKTTLTGTLNISIDHLDGLLEGQDIYLKDNLLNIVHDLKASAYSFTSVPGTFNERFILRYLPDAELSNPDHEHIAKGLILYQEENKILIQSQLQNLKQVTVYDLLGRVVYEQSGIEALNWTIENIVLNQQPLIVKILLQNGQVVNKKIVY